VTGLIVMAVGAVVAAAGYVRFRGPWARYQALKAQDANVARYESWRGGLRDSGTTGASVAMDILRTQARQAGAIMIAGVAAIVVGLLLWR
jgi:hypothetical protein